MSVTVTTPAPPPVKRLQPGIQEQGPRWPWPAPLRWLEVAVLAGLAYVPLLLVRPGVATPDTKTYLYLDPGRFLAQVASMWNTNVALGTVTHEYIGYLLPMGPFFWFFHVIGVPVWVAQRLWLGSILFAAGMGVRYLCRVFSVDGPARVAAALAYLLSPYFLQYAGRISVILLPWAGLPWMIGFAAMALRRPGWRYPALFALVVALVSGINASSIIYVGVAPVLWIVYAVAVERQTTLRRAAATTLQLGLLTLLVCVWWIVGLRMEAAYGVNVLKYTETIPSTSATSNPTEVIRGLGYWYFYGGDRLGPWTPSSVLYTQTVWLLGMTYVLPVLAFLSAALVRWRHRAFFIALVVVGVVLSVGAYPYTSPTPLGGLLKAFMSDTTAGLAMRSTDRATPLVVLGLAVLVGAGVSAVWRRVPWAGIGTGALVCAIAIANNPALFNGDTIANDFTQPAKLPAYEMAAIAHLNATHPETRVLAIPGDDFSSFRWGNTVDTPQPAFLTRPFVIREQQIMGSEATADTLYAIDDPIQEDTENWNALAPMARLLSAGDILVENDTQYEHYGIPQPQILALQLATTPTGLSDPETFGTPVPNVSEVSTLDEQDLAAPANTPWPAPLVTYTVDNPRPITRAESDSGALIVSGDASGLEDVAGLGLLNTDSAIYYSGNVTDHPSQLHQLVSQGAALVVTDTNRKQAFRWDTLSANTGETETPSENPATTDPSDSPIDLFPGAGLSSKSYAQYVGAVDVSASSYGNSVSYTPEDRPYSAVDDNLDTAWETGTFVPDPSGQWWQERFATPVTESQVTLIQPQRGDLTRHVTRVTLTFDGGHPITEDLGPASLAPTGQTITFPARAFRTLRVTIDATSDDHAPPATASAVGFAEVQLPGQHVTEVVLMPTDLLTAAGTASVANRLTLVMTRLRTSPYPPRSDPETTISRQFTLPTARTFTLSGLASISPLVPDDEIDRLVGRPGADGTGIVAYSQGRLPGDLMAGASAAADGSLSTAWQPGFGASHQAGEWLMYNLPAPITFDHLNLEVLADGRHSVPTAITVATEYGSHAVTLPPIADSSVPGATVSVPVSFPPLYGAHIRITVDDVRLEDTTNYYSSTPIALPLGIAEIGIPGVRVPPVPATLPGNCQPGLVTIDGQQVYVSVVGSTSAALNNGEMQVVPCGPDAAGIPLSAGAHVVETALGHTAGWNIDQLVLDSAPGGGPEAGPVNGALVATQPGPAPVVRATYHGQTTVDTTVKGASAPFELVLGESINRGWTAVAHPGPGALPGAHSVNLGAPQLLDSFANGWQVSQSDLAALGAIGAGGTPSFTVTLTWAPQGEVWAALLISALAIAACVVLAAIPLRLRRRVGVGSVGRARHAPGRSAEPPTPAGGADAVGAPETSAATGITLSAPAAAAPAAPIATAPPAAPTTTAPCPAEPAPVTAPAEPSDGGDRDPQAAPSGVASPAPAGTSTTGHTPGTDLPATVGAADTSPMFSRLVRADGWARPHWWTALLAAAVTGGAAAAIVSPRVGLAAGLAAFVAMLVPQLRMVVGLVATGLLVAAAVQVTRGQLLHPVPESADWPAADANQAILVWTAVVLLGVDGVVESARRLAALRKDRRPRGQEEEERSAPSPGPGAAVGNGQTPGNST